MTLVVRAILATARVWTEIMGQEHDGARCKDPGG